MLLFRNVQKVPVPTKDLRITGMRVGSDEKNRNWCEAKKTELNLYYIRN